MVRVLWSVQIRDVMFVFVSFSCLLLSTTYILKKIWRVSHHHQLLPFDGCGHERLSVARSVGESVGGVRGDTAGTGRIGRVVVGVGLGNVASLVGRGLLWLYPHWLAVGSAWVLCRWVLSGWVLCAWVLGGCPCWCQERGLIRLVI